MAILLKTASVRVSSIQIMQVRVQNKGKSVWKSRYDGDVSVSAVCVLGYLTMLNFVKTLKSDQCIIYYHAPWDKSTLCF